MLRAAEAAAVSAPEAPAQQHQHQHQSEAFHGGWCSKKQRLTFAIPVASGFQLAAMYMSVSYLIGFDKSPYVNYSATTNHTLLVAIYGETRTRLRNRACPMSKHETKIQTRKLFSSNFPTSYVSLCCGFRSIRKKHMYVLVYSYHT